MPLPYSLLQLLQWDYVNVTERDSMGSALFFYLICETYSQPYTRDGDSQINLSQRGLQKRRKKGINADICHFISQINLGKST